MIRVATRPTTANCTLPMYMGFLISEPKFATCRHLGEVLNISHDSVNRFLLREAYSPSDLYAEAIGKVNPVGGTLSVDDTVLDKPYSQKMALVGRFWSGKHHQTVKGINLITLYYSDNQGRHQPVNYRVYDKEEGKTKNDYFLEMLAEVLAWGLKPAFITGDSWYASKANLKAIKNYGLSLVFALESNRLISTEKGKWQQVQKAEIPEDGLIVWLRGFGQVKVFRTRLKNQLRHYVAHLPDVAQLLAFDQEAFRYQHDQHWKIEQYHRAIKQVCNIERFQVRGKTPILNHLFAAILSYVHLQQLCALDVIANIYRLQRDLFQEIVASFIHDFVAGKEHLNTQFFGAVNA